MYFGCGIDIVRLSNTFKIYSCQVVKMICCIARNLLRPVITFRSTKVTNITTCLKCKFGVRNFQTTKCLSHGDFEWKDPQSEEEVVRITYIDKDGKKTDVRGKVGDNAMYLAHRHGIEMEGACEASLACTTCHVYVQHEYLDKLPEALEKEEDLLDLAPFLQENSRLGCQIILKKEYDGMVLELPKATRNFYVDGHKPKPH